MALRRLTPCVDGVANTTDVEIDYIGAQAATTLRSCEAEKGYRAHERANGLPLDISRKWQGPDLPIILCHFHL
jgi:hypothetical protein